MLRTPPEELRSYFGEQLRNLVYYRKDADAETTKWLAQTRNYTHFLSPEAQKDPAWAFYKK